MPHTQQYYLFLLFKIVIYRLCVLIIVDSYALPRQRRDSSHSQYIWLSFLEKKVNGHEAENTRTHGCVCVEIFLNEHSQRPQELTVHASPPHRIFIAELTESARCLDNARSEPL